MNKFFISEALFLDIQKEVDDFKLVVFDRLLLSFSEIDNEAKLKSDEFSYKASNNFDPDFHDEALIYEDAYFVQINYESIHYSLKQDFLNLSAVWLYHIFERRFVDLFGNSNANNIKLEQSKIFNSTYNFKICDNWITINNELRLLANSIKNGAGKSFNELNLKYPNLIVNYKIIVKENDIQRYIISMKNFWDLALKDKFVTANKDNF